MVTITSGKVYLTTGSFSGGPPYTTITGGTTVALDLIDWEDSINKAVTLIQRPVPRGAWTTTEPVNWLLDLKKIKRVIKFVGRIKNDGDGTALSKKANLLVLAGLGSGSDARSGTIIVLWGGANSNTEEYVVCNFEKLLFKKSATGKRPIDANPTDIAMNVTISMVVGTNR